MVADEDGNFLKVLVLVSLVVFFTGLFLGAFLQSRSIQAKAVENGCGKYIVDKNGKVDFEWIKCDE